MEIMMTSGINVAMQGTTKSEILRELADLAVENGKVTDAAGFYKDLCLREDESTTGFGGGIAIPHAKSAFVSEVGVLVGRGANLVEWEAMDGQPVQCWICLLVPETGGQEHLRLLSQLSRKLVDPEFVGKLKTGTENEILALVQGVIS
ncbi:PTS fructose transporter subunit IIA [Paenilisteria rocourtiae]|uniref:PTS system IIA component (Fru family) n=1 Tax=Listeria rocourtiae TaxID=647910 RepID=A0A4R6ZHI4_9LIST|nr:PTS fructose transporter subunit IIA [Listeria rocourtiae]EUJ46640.1 fructose-like phosphotransferase system subunit EIIA [Listeria rocourtiae FSL F6-920]MBC1605935.1 PTS fructose transporter subunit IIA [Listeria rocourtiae]TDR51757.1 PTS system IIA component (Fru family) [Listeria rocourtiae]